MGWRPRTHPPANDPELYERWLLLSGAHGFLEEAHGAVDRLFPDLASKVAEAKRDCWSELMRVDQERVNREGSE